MKNLMQTLMWAIFMAAGLSMNAQTNNSELRTSINQTGAAPDNSAILDIQSDDHGLLIPRMNSAQRIAINSGMPAEGLLVFDTNTNSFWYFDGTLWQDLSIPETLWSKSSLGVESDSSNVGINSGPNEKYNLIVRRTFSDFGPGRSAIYGHRSGSSVSGEEGGTAWESNEVDAAIIGYNDWGNYHTAGVMGYNFHDFGASAAVGGATPSGNHAGFLCYRDTTATGASGDYWSGYFSEDVKIEGKLELPLLSGIGQRPLFVNQDGELEVNATKKEYELVLGISNFWAPRQKSINFTNNHSFGGAGYTEGGRTVQMRVPINLPVGTKVTEVKIYYKDNSATNNYQINIDREKTATNGFGTSIGTFLTSGTSSTYLSHTYTNDFTLSNIYSYYVRVSPCYTCNDVWDDMLIKSVVVKYELPD